MRRWGRRATLRAAFALLLAAGTAHGRPDEGVEERPAAEVEKASASLASGFGQAIVELRGYMGTHLVAALDVRPFQDLPEAHQDAQALQSAWMQRLLQAGYLVYPYERERKIAVEYEYEKLPQGLLASEGDLNALAEREVQWLMVPRLLPHERGYTFLVELYDPRTSKRVGKLEVEPVPTKRFTMRELLGPDVLPPRNVRILEFAIENIGRQVDRGECWDVPAVPIRADGGSPDGYALGAPVAWEEALSGDVITFGTSGDTGGHVAVLLRWSANRSQATVLHQNWGGRRVVMVEGLDAVERGKRGQALAVWRP